MIQTFFIKKSCSQVSASQQLKYDCIRNFMLVLDVIINERMQGFKIFLVSSSCLVGQTINCFSGSNVKPRIRAAVCQIVFGIFQEFQNILILVPCNLRLHRVFLININPSHPMWLICLSILLMPGHMSVAWKCRKSQIVKLAQME